MAREVQDRVLALVEDSLGLPLVREQCPAWLVRPGAAECGDLWDQVSETYTALTGLVLPQTMPTRERRSLDGIVKHPDGRMRIVEVDEAQHFNPFRALTLSRYPRTAEVAFDRDVWSKRSMASTKLRGGGWGRPKPPLFPEEGGRHLQRAFRDMLADLLPPQRGWAPTLRIAHFEVEGWLESPEAPSRMTELLTTKLDVAR